MHYTKTIDEKKLRTFEHSTTKYFAVWNII